VIVVLDTNVWISALEFGGTPNRALFRALTQDQLAISGSISAEIERVLTQKFDRDPVELQVLLDESLAQGLQIKVTGENKRSLPGDGRDRRDDHQRVKATRGDRPSHAFLSVFSEVIPQRLCLTRGQGEHLPDLIGRASEITYA
jgi:hypothetical protein